jgi:5-methylcytosine-specific restriction endonuclease McrA
MRTCSKCREEKSVNDFSNRKTKKGTVIKHRICKSCSTDYKRSWESKSRKVVRDYVFNYLSTNPCNGCGSTDVLSLEFDHIDPKQKSLNVCKAISGKEGYRFSLEELITEISKCQVLCRNCHQAKTHKDNNSWRWQMLNQNN